MPAIFRYALFSLVVIFTTLASAAEPSAWTPLGPGGGATITTVHCDNVRKNHVWVGTRTHGLYYTPNGGGVWIYRGYGLGNAVVSAIETEPREKEHPDKKQRPDRKKEPADAPPRAGTRVYAGTARGLYYSDNMGVDWNFAEDTKDAPIGGVVINPYNVDEVYAFEGWTTLDDEITDLLADGVTIDGDRRIWVSHDRGVSFKDVKYERTQGFRRAYSLVIDPNDPSNLYLGAHAGAYQSKNSGKSWKRLKDPKGAKSGVKAKTREDGMRGLDITGGGQWLVGVFANSNGDYVPCIADTKTLTWTEAGAELPKGGSRRRGSQNEYATPRFVTSANGVAIVLAQLAGSRVGLYSGSGEIEKGKAELKWTLICQSPGEDSGEKEFTFRMGWTRGAFRVRALDVAPESWGSSALAFSTTETILLGNPNANGFPYSITSWQDITTAPPSEEGGTGSKSPGIQANDVRDVARDGRYLIASAVGNGLLESYNGGESWALAARPFESALASEACAIIPADKPLVIAHVRSTWGQSAGTNALYAKKLLNRSKDDKWMLVGGGSNAAAGLPNDRILAILPHRSRPNQVLVATAANGIWFAETFSAILDEEGGKWVNATAGSGLENAEISGFQQDPLERDVFWATSKGKKAGLWRGEPDGRKWKWKQVTNIKEGDSLGGLCVWQIGSARLIAMAYAESSKEGAGVYLSHDDGEHFVAVLSAADAAKLSPMKWAQVEKASLGLRVTASMAVASDLFVAIADPKRGVGLGVIRIRLDAAGKASFALWNGESGASLQQSRVAKLLPYFDEKGTWVYAALPGGGVAVRALDEFVESKPADAPSKD